MATVSCLVMNILQTIFLSAQQKKETRTGLEQLYSEYMMLSLFSSLGELSL